MKYYDTHCHICCEPLQSNADFIVEACKQKEVIINNVGVDVETSKKAIEQANLYSNCYAIVGIHPSEIKDEDQINVIEELAKNHKVVAIGETGLDYHFQPYDKQKQIKSFIEHIKLANKLNLPLVVHTRDAADDTFNILKNNISNTQKVLIHCFSGSKEELVNYLSIGCYISISGIITFKKSEELRECLKLIPEDKLLIETDAPYLAPVPFRGKECMPYYVIYTFEYICNYLNTDKEQLREKIFLNSLKLFNINDFSR